MKAIKCFGFLLTAVILLLALTFSGCSPTPDNAQIERAIHSSLSTEQAAPDLAFETMEVPIRYRGKAGAVLWTQDKAVQRNYAITYDRKAKAFVVESVTTSVRSEDGGYSIMQPAPLTEYADRFGFSDSISERVAFVYVGNKTTTPSAMSEFEQNYFADLSDEALSQFELCDLGGKEMVLLVPKYQGTSIRITVVEYSGDALVTGEEIARFENNNPIYLLCEWNGSYDIQIFFAGSGGFIHAYDAVLEACKQAENGYIY